MIENPTRASYDIIATDYAEYLANELDDRPVDRAMLAAFAEIAGAGGRVADVGCGPGRVTTLLHDLGLDAYGMDLSPGMLAVARKTYPHLLFEEGTMSALDVVDGELAGIVAWYSIIHIAPDQRPAVFAELHRALAPGAPLLLAFQVGDEALRVSEALGHEVALDFQRLRPERIADELTAAGFAMYATLVRERIGNDKVQQAVVLARRGV
ncbi:class I SAM-dependent DNA methyltransferase [Phytohabitans aurantiacus]|uniref:Methyltransferase n=1 Tax=Phytohabitans aurantiacus TaxID=3016789 RepID=A0ABQ5RCU1_9ACTN|nr:class I SAM-dependent methyltransferase [Phytohabitans aurantiacus]GLI03747.1 methyltransferase [Phytohabitans aurantiacus]